MSNKKYKQVDLHGRWQKVTAAAHFDVEQKSQGSVRLTWNDGVYPILTSYVRFWPGTPPDFDEGLMMRYATFESLAGRTFDVYLWLGEESPLLEEDHD